MMITLEDKAVVISLVFKKRIIGPQPTLPKNLEDDSGLIHKISTKQDRPPEVNKVLPIFINRTEPRHPHLIINSTWILTT